MDIKTWTGDEERGNLRLDEGLIEGRKSNCCDASSQAPSQLPHVLIKALHTPGSTSTRLLTTIACLFLTLVFKDWHKTLNFEQRLSRKCRCAYEARLHSIFHSAVDAAHLAPTSLIELFNGSETLLDDGHPPMRRRSSVGVFEANSILRITISDRSSLSPSQFPDRIHESSLGRLGYPEL